MAMINATKLLKTGKNRGGRPKNWAPKGGSRPRQRAHKGKEGGAGAKSTGTALQSPGTADSAPGSQRSGLRIPQRRVSTMNAVHTPWTPQNQHDGRSNIGLRAFVKCAILMTGKPCRDMETHLRSRTELLRRLGLKCAPLKSTLNRAVRRIARTCAHTHTHTPPRARRHTAALRALPPPSFPDSEPARGRALPSLLART